MRNSVTPRLSRFRQPAESRHCGRYRKAVDLLVLSGQKAADLSGAYGLILNAPCPVMTLLSERDLMIYGKTQESKNIVNKFGPEFLISLFPEAKGLLKLVS